MCINGLGSAENSSCAELCFHRLVPLGELKHQLFAVLLLFTMTEKSATPLLFLLSVLYFPVL